MDQNEPTDAPAGKPRNNLKAEKYLKSRENKVINTNKYKFLKYNNFYFKFFNKIEYILINLVIKCLNWKMCVCETP